jgi:uncharacterized RDD family membrane protein YckC
VPWPAQVRDLALKAPRSNPFEDAVRQARPAGAGRRLVARLIDTVLTGAVVGAVAVPLVRSGYDHVERKMDAARQTGQTVRVWLLDGTTGAQLAALVGVVLVVGVLYEVLPTATWGRTLGKRLLGVRVLDVEAQQPPGVGAALRRWLVRWVLDALVVGAVGLAWCLFDRPWRQCWHDKAARTFVGRD